MSSFIRMFLIGLSLLSLFSTGVTHAGEYPCLLFSKSEILQIKESLQQAPLFNRVFKNQLAETDVTINNPVTVPPPGEAGGYEHERHKQNYRDMQQAGMMFVFSGDEKYAKFVCDMLFAYADLYPTLGPHPQAHHQRPGKIFHQLLNETVWLMHTTMAYDCIYEWLSEEQRYHIEKNIFAPAIQWITVEHKSELDRIHNHGIWTVAAIGMLGYVLGDQNLVDMALYGSLKDGNGGFFRQLDGLFSPDGYYMEGPYYARYALRPLFYFAEAIERNQPDLRIYQYRNGIIGKSHYGAVNTIFPNGVFPPINDASRTMNVRDIGPVVSNSLTYFRYGEDPELLAIASIQDNLLLTPAGFVIAQDLAALDTSPQFNLPSIELRDGIDGEKGGLGILRQGSGSAQTMVLMKYGVHGMGHGHFDKLHFSLYDQGAEVIFDYGFARWINIEPKFGGRYLPENDSYAKQSIAHNTVTVDQKTQNLGNPREAEKVSGESHFFDQGTDIQVMSAHANHFYPDVRMQRTIFLIGKKYTPHPVIIDLFKIHSQDEHEYDYPLHFHGQVMSVNPPIESLTADLKPLGSEHGYQHIWKTAAGIAEKQFGFTWLHGQRFYSFLCAAESPVQVFFGQTGANDPDFNLRNEPLLIVRKKSTDHLFATVIEAHGLFDEAQEMSEQARPLIEEIRVVGSNETASIIEISGKNINWRLMVTHEEASDSKEHTIRLGHKIYQWTGNYNFIDLAQNDREL